MRMGLDKGAVVGRQLRVLLFAASSAARGEILPATHPVTKLVESRLDGVASPTEASFSLSSTAAAEFGSHLGLEQAALISRELSGTRSKQGVEVLGGFVDHGGTSWRQDRDGSTQSLASSGKAG